MAISNDSSPARQSDIVAIEKQTERQVDNGAQDIIISSEKDLESIPPIDHVAEAKLIRKLDLYIIPPTLLLYLFSFLDR